MIRACWDDNVDVRPTFANMAPRLAVALAAVNASPPPELDTPIEGMHNVYARSCVMYKYGAVRLLQYVMPAVNASLPPELDTPIDGMFLLHWIQCEWYVFACGFVLEENAHFHTIVNTLC